MTRPPGLSLLTGAWKFRPPPAAAPARNIHGNPELSKRCLDGVCMGSTWCPHGVYMVSVCIMSAWYLHGVDMVCESSEHLMVTIATLKCTMYTCYLSGIYMVSTWCVSSLCPTLCTWCTCPVDILHLTCVERLPDRFW